MIETEFKFGTWYPIETAPKDGTKIDLLYPYPRGRTINCFWAQYDLAKCGFGWVWRTPTWGEGGRDPDGLLPEAEWDVHSYANMDPTHWMPLPPPPSQKE